MDKPKLKPKHSYIHIDDARDTLNLPDINLLIEPEKKSLKPSIIIVDKPVKHNSIELF